MKKLTQSGITLIELTVVLLILVALAGLVIPYMGGTSNKAFCDATDLSMQNIKKTIMDRYYLDTLGQFPVNKGTTEYSLSYLMLQGGWNPYDPQTTIGWRGPYLMTSATLKSATELSTNLASDPGTYVHKKFADGDVIINDAWGRPIILQVPTLTDCQAIIPSSPNKEDYCARLVSAGSGSGLGISEADIETPLNSTRPSNSDDRILYLNAPTPVADINSACVQ